MEGIGGIQLERSWVNRHTLRELLVIFMKPTDGPDSPLDHDDCDSCRALMAMAEKLGAPPDMVWSTETPRDAFDGIYLAVIYLLVRMLQGQGPIGIQAAKRAEFLRLVAITTDLFHPYRAGSLEAPEMAAGDEDQDLAHGSDSGRTGACVEQPRQEAKS